MNRLEHSVICPDPDCDWKASGGFDSAVVVEPSWRIGVIRDAVEAERLAHVRERHVRVEGGEF